MIRDEEAMEYAHFFGAALKRTGNPTEAMREVLDRHRADVFSPKPKAFRPPTIEKRSRKGRPVDQLERQRLIQRCAAVLAEVAAFYQTTADVLHEDRRQAYFCSARNEAIWRCRHQLGAKWNAMVVVFKRDRSTLIHAYRVFARELVSDKELAARVLGGAQMELAPVLEARAVG